MPTTRRQLFGTGAVAVGAAATLTACTAPVARPPKMHTYSYRTLNGYRRDLYRAPGEGYEEWYPQPPPTRLPSTPPRPVSAATTPRSNQGVITFPEETALPESGH